VISSQPSAAAATRVPFSQLGAHRASDFTIYYLDGHALREGRDSYAPADFAAVRNEFPTLPALAGGSLPDT
jgi:hypothetical protein